jgi:[ribosomal protein S5]-alanine N-acetyltransferase
VFAFETARLQMRSLDENDESLHCELYTDAETMRFIHPPLSPERALRMFREMIAQPRPAAGPFLFAIGDKISQVALGICAVVAVDTGIKHAEVGVMLKSDARGLGYARESLAGTVEHVYRTFPVQRVWVECSALNPVVERMVGSIGFLLDETGAGVGPLLQRTWSVRRSSWCLSKQHQPSRGKHVERHTLS